MPDTIDDARRMIEARLADLDAEARQLGRALSHLRDGEGNRRPAKARSASTSRSTSKDGRRRPSRRKAGKRARRGQRREELLAAIEASPGARPAELATTMGIAPAQVSALIAKARAENLIVKSGEGYAPAP